jgi:hypothetical protein
MTKFQLKFFGCKEFYSKFYHYKFDMCMSKAAFISNDIGNLACFTALYVTSQRGHCPLLIRYVNTHVGAECGRGGGGSRVYMLSIKAQLITVSCVIIHKIG